MRAELLLLLLLPAASALIHPPIAEVMEHNRAIAPADFLDENVLGEPEREPTLGNPSFFLYARILTLNPSVNGSVVGNVPGLHPELIWLVAGRHAGSLTEASGADGECRRSVIRRTYGEMELESVAAHYTLSGLARMTDEGIVYESASETVVVADNETSISNPSQAPFRNPGALCMLADVASRHVLGGVADLECGEPLLSRASPYAEGTLNLTERNLTVVRPRLNVTLAAEFTIPYEERGRECWETGDGCECDEWEREGRIRLSSSDFRSYEVHNTYSGIIPYSPSFLNLSANTSEDVIYYYTFLSNSELYKYHSRMDNKTGNAYYYHNFSVAQDAYGTRFIEAHEADIREILPEDSGPDGIHEGPSAILASRHGTQLRNPREITNASYNYSGVHTIKDVYYNLSVGEHRADIELHTWWGSFNLSSDIYVRNTTSLLVEGVSLGGAAVVAECLLRDRWGNPLGGEVVELRIGGDSKSAVTDGSGRCRAAFEMQGYGFLNAYYEGSDAHLPSSAFGLVRGASPVSVGRDLVFVSPPLTILLALLCGIGLLGAAGAGGRILPFSKGGSKKPAKKMVNVKKGKAAAAAVAGAAAGGAGSAAAKKAAGDAARKAAEKQALKKAAEKKAAEKKKKIYTMEDWGRPGKKSKKMLVMVAGPGGRGSRSEEPPGRRDPDEVERRNKKALGRAERERERMRESEKNVWPGLVEAFRKEAEGIRGGKILELEQCLGQKEDSEALKDAKGRLSGLRICLVDNRAWGQAARSNGMHPQSSHALYDSSSNEIFMSHRRAIDERAMEKTLRHETDHAACVYMEAMLSEGHADMSAKQGMGKRWHPMLASYPHAGAACEILTSMAGEGPGSNRSAYRFGDESSPGGSAELRSRIIQRHGDLVKGDADSIFERMAKVPADDREAAKRIYSEVESMWMKTNPSEERVRRIRREWGI